MIDAFVFSKDRACQLECLLRSCRQQAPGLFRWHVLWKASTPAFARGYGLLRERLAGEGVNWVEETAPVKQHFLDIIRAAPSNLLCLFTDDCYFYRSFPHKAAEIVWLMGEESILTFAFRLGRNTIVQNYQTGECQPPLQPEMTFGDHYLAWSYGRHHFAANYGYPFGMDGHVFRTSDLLAWTEPMEMPNFRAWEGALHLPQHRDAMPRKLMACPVLSTVVNIPANSVQVGAVPAGVHHYSSLHDLNECWLNGLAIDLSGLDLSRIASSHLELPWRLTPYGQCLAQG